MNRDKEYIITTDRRKIETRGPLETKSLIQITRTHTTQRNIDIDSPKRLPAG